MVRIDSCRSTVRSPFGLFRPSFLVAVTVAACGGADGRDLASRTVAWLQSATDGGAYAPPGTPPDLAIAGYSD